MLQRVKKIVQQSLNPKYRLLLMAGAFILISILFVVFQSLQKTSANTFYVHNLEIVKSSSQMIQSLNKDPSAQKEPQLDKYKEALTDGLSSCRKMQNRNMELKTEKNIDSALIDKTKSIDQFCADYELVTDYARLQSNATKQLILFIDSTLDKKHISEKDITTLQEILGYTRTDLNKLKSNPANDPALDELIVGIDQAIERGRKLEKADPSTYPQSYFDELNRLHSNYLSARLYYWNNTVRISALERAIDNLQNSFKQD